MDMSPAYLKGAAEYFPAAQIVFDKFHVMVLAGQALDTVRRQLQHEGAALKGSLWSLRGNVLEPQCRTPETATRSLCAVHQTGAGDDFARDAASHLR
jgi:transposase